MDKHTALCRILPCRGVWG